MDNKEFDVINYNGVPYSNISNLINVFSSTEYDSLEKAASEIIDNAVDANAKNISIFLRSAHYESKGKSFLNEIAFLDDGEGMSPGRLQHVVGFGSTSRGDSEGVIGKFGIGLNQASLFACQRFEVYTWTSQDEVYLEVFDVEEIKATKREYAPVPIKTTLPSYVMEYKDYEKYKNHGTLIIWKKLKDANIVRATTIRKRMQSEFGRVYRYFICNNSLNLCTIIDDIEKIKAVDPMFLLNNTEKLGDVNGGSKLVDDGEPLFELFENEILTCGTKTYKIPFYDKNNEIKESYIILRASIVKEKFYYQAAYKDNIKQPGDTEIGSYVKEFQKGITIVRNNREIDFGYFGFYDSTNQPQDRWFKLEIIFTEELDEIFHVSNNKQHVEIKKPLKSKILDFKETDPNYPLWLRLEKDITKLLGAMRKRNRKLAENAKKGLISVKETPPNISEPNVLDIFDEFEDKDKPKPIKQEEDIIEIPKYKNKLEEYLELKDICIFEDQLDKKIIIESRYNVEVRKYFITFNSLVIDKSKLSNELIVFICLMCKEQKRYSYSSNEYKIIQKLIDNHLTEVVKFVEE